MRLVVGPSGGQCILPVLGNDDGARHRGAVARDRRRRRNHVVAVGSKVDHLVLDQLVAAAGSQDIDGFGVEVVEGAPAGPVGPAQSALAGRVLAGLARDGMAGVGLGVPGGWAT